MAELSSPEKRFSQGERPSISLLRAPSPPLPEEGRPSALSTRSLGSLPMIHSISVHFAGKSLGIAVDRLEDEVYVRPGWSSNMEFDENTPYVVECCLLDPQGTTPEGKKYVKVRRTYKNFRELNAEMVDDHGLANIPSLVQPNSKRGFLRSIFSKQTQRPANMPVVSHLANYLTKLKEMPLPPDCERMLTEFLVGGAMFGHSPSGFGDRDRELSLGHAVNLTPEKRGLTRRNLGRHIGRGEYETKEEIMRRLRVDMRRMNRSAVSQDPNASGADTYVSASDTDQAVPTPPVGRRDFPSKSLAGSRMAGLLGDQPFLDLLDDAEWITMGEGTAVFQEGDSTDDGMYIVVEGSLGVFHRAAPPPGLQAPLSTEKLAPGTPGGMPSPTPISSMGSTISASEPLSLDSDGLVGTVEAGESVGEMAVTRVETRRHLTCVALGQVQLVRVTKKIFHSWASMHPFEAVLFIKRVVLRQWQISWYVFERFLRVEEKIKAAAYPRVSDLSRFKVDCSALPVTRLLKGNTFRLVGPEKRRSQIDGATEEAIEHHMVVILKGTMRTSGNGAATKSMRIPSGSVVGGLGVLAGVPQVSELVALEDTEVLCFNAHTFDNALQIMPQVAYEISLAVVSEMAPVISEFSKLGLGSMWLQPAKAGGALYWEDEESDCMYIVISGRVRLRKVLVRNDGSRSEHTVASVGRGESFGEEALQKTRRVSDAICVRDCELVRVSKVAFGLICQSHPSAVFQFNSALAKRLQQVTEMRSTSDDSTSASVSTIALVPSVDVDVDFLVMFARKLARELGRHGQTRILESSFVDNQFGRGASQRLREEFFQCRMSLLLSEIEETHRFVLFVVDPIKSVGWTRYCLRQSDMVFVVGRFNTTAGVSKSLQPRLSRRNVEDDDHESTGWAMVEAEPPRPPSEVLGRLELVLLHESNDEDYQPVGTSRWLHALEDQGIHVQLHHHVLVSRPTDLSRVARYLSGKANGVVLSGGSARGMAHWGALKAMEDHNIPIDFIGGTSQGSFMAALYARYLSTMHPKFEANSKFFATETRKFQNYLKDMTLPVISFFAGKTPNMIMRRIFEDIQIEDLWIPFFCVTTNVTKCDIGVHTRGSLWRYTRASMGIFGLVPPLPDTNGDLLVDGAYCDNLPIAVIRRLYPVRVIFGVDVENKNTEVFENTTHYGDSLSGCWLVGKKLNPFTRKKIKVPSHMDIQFSLGFLAHTQQLRAAVHNSPDRNRLVYLRLPVDDYGMLDFHKLPQLCEVGYDYTHTKITEWKQRAVHLN